MADRSPAGVVRIRRVALLTMLKVMIVTGALSIVAGAVANDESGKAENAVSNQPNISVDDLQLQYERWIEAVQGGDPELVDECERTLMAMINADIAVSQTRVHELADSVVSDSNARSSSATRTGSNGSNGNNGGNGAADATSSEASRAEFRECLATLNTKEALWLALEKTTDVSHKYRLLGDYINLLRRELHMPRLDWAAVDHSTGNVARQGP